MLHYWATTYCLGFFFFFFQPDSGEESGLCITLHISYTYLCFEQVRNTKL